MPEQLDLLSYSPPTNYPDRPGFRRRTTSKEAARAIESRAGTLRAKALDRIRLASSFGLTADEVAGIMGVSVLAIRPRCSELAAKGLIIDSKQRRDNSSGKKAIVWIVARKEG